MLFSLKLKCRVQKNSRISPSHPRAIYILKSESKITVGRSVCCWWMKGVGRNLQTDPTANYNIISHADRCVES